MDNPQIKTDTSRGIICPSCKSENTMVMDSRAAPCNTIRRRRMCADCGDRFTTYEAVLNQHARTFISKIRTQQDFVVKNISKLEHLIHTICEHIITSKEVEDVKNKGDTNALHS